MLRSSWLTLEINEFRCCEMKIAAVTAKCATEAFSAAHIEDCEGWWSSGCHGSLTENWWLKPEMSWVWLPVGFFTFLYFRLITSKFIYKAIYVATCTLLVPLDQWKVWVSHSVWCQNVLPIVPIHCCCMNSAMKKTKAIIVIKSMHGLCYFLHHTWYLVCIGK